MRSDESYPHTENGCERYEDYSKTEKSRADMIRTQGPEIQQMYSLNMPVSKIRTKIREEYEKNRYVNQIGAVDVLIMQSDMEFQVRQESYMLEGNRHRQELIADHTQETLNYWKQLSHIMKYFRKEEDPTARLPNNFISGFLEVRDIPIRVVDETVELTMISGTQLISFFKPQRDRRSSVHMSSAA